MNVYTPRQKKYSSLRRLRSYDSRPTKRIRRSNNPIDIDVIKRDTDILEGLDYLLEDTDNSLYNGAAGVYSKDNHIYYKSKVDKGSIEELIDLLDDKNEEYAELKKHKLVKSLTPSPIYLHISSYGGDLLMGFKAVDAIERSKVPVHTIVDGPVASAASLMAVVGKKRYMTPNSYHLIHQLSSGVWGKYSEIKDDWDNCSSFMDKIVNIYDTNSDMEEKEIREYLKHDLWWEKDKCFSTGLVDEVWKGK